MVVLMWPGDLMLNSYTLTLHTIDAFFFTLQRLSVLALDSLVLNTLVLNSVKAKCVAKDHETLSFLLYIMLFSISMSR